MLIVSCRSRAPILLIRARNSRITSPTMPLGVDPSPGSTARQWPLRRFPRQARAASASLLSASPAILRDVSHFEAARVVPKSADQHDAAAQYGHCRHRRVRAYDCRGRGSHRGSTPARAQDHRVGSLAKTPTRVSSTSRPCVTRLGRAVFSPRRSLQTSSKRRRSCGAG